MPKGSYDFGLPAAIGTQDPSYDINELAARLVGNFKINRSGNVVNNLNDIIMRSRAFDYLYDANCYNFPSNTYGNYNQPSLKCVTSAVASAYAGTYMQFPYYAGNQIGVQAQLISGGLTGTVYVQYIITTVGQTTRGGIKLDMSNGALSVLTGLSTYTSVGTLQVPTAGAVPFIVKFSFDKSTGKYGKLWYGSELAFDISSYSWYNEAAGTAKNTVLYCYILNNGSTSNTFYINDVIITNSEVT